MRVFVFLALVLWLLLDWEFGAASGSGEAEQKKGGKCKGFKVKKVLGRLNNLLTGQKSAHQIFHSIADPLESSTTSYSTIEENRNLVEKNLVKANESLSDSRSNAGTILSRQSEIITGQSDIQKRINSEHKSTLEAVKDFGDALDRNFEAVENNQDRILDQSEQGKTKVDKGIESLISKEKNTEALLKEVQQALADSAEASAAGQFKVLWKIRESGEITQEGLGTVMQNQGSILNKLAESQASVEKSINRILDKQIVIDQAIQDSQAAYKEELIVVEKQQAENEEDLKSSRSGITNEISDVQREESAIQSILEECRRDGGCDVSGIIDNLSEVQEQIAQTEESLRKDVDAILASQSSTQDTVDLSVDNVDHEVNSRIEEAVAGLKDFEKSLEAFILGILKRFTDDNVIEDTKEIEAEQARVVNVCDQFFKQLDDVLHVLTAKPGFGKFGY